MPHCNQSQTTDNKRQRQANMTLYEAVNDQLVMARDVHRCAKREYRNPRHEVHPFANPKPDEPIRSLCIFRFLMCFPFFSANERLQDWGNLFRHGDSTCAKESHVHGITCPVQEEYDCTVPSCPEWGKRKANKTITQSTNGLNIVSIDVIVWLVLRNKDIINSLSPLNARTGYNFLAKQAHDLTNITNINPATAIADHISDLWSDNLHVYIDAGGNTRERDVEPNLHTECPFETVPQTKTPNRRKRERSHATFEWSRWSRSVSNNVPTPHKAWSVRSSF